MCLSQFLQSLVPPLVGSFSGVFVAFLINSYISRRKRKKQRKDLLLLLHAALEKNKLRVEKLEEKLERGIYTPHYKIDVLPLESTVSLQYELIDSFNLKKNLDTVRYELSHLNRKLDILVTTQNNEDYRIAVVDSTLALLRGNDEPSLSKRLEDTLTLINSELGDNA